MRVLVVEDDPDIQIVLRMVLTRLGKCDVSVAFEGSKVLPLAKQEAPAFILLDVMLPDQSGLEICKALKADPATQNIPVIFLTARSMPNEAQAAKNLGALGYLTKPFDPMTLVPQINALLTPAGITLGAS